MANYCINCAIAKGYPRPPVRTGGRRGTPCPNCGFKDPLGLYSYPDHLLPDNPANPNNVAEREERERNVST